MTIIHLYWQNVMHSAVDVVARSPTVSLSVFLFITFRYCVKIDKDIVENPSQHDSHKRHSKFLGTNLVTKFLRST